jgi:uncharacterized protein with ACT and thioredoxin-like domain
VEVTFSDLMKRKCEMESAGVPESERCFIIGRREFNELLNSMYYFEDYLAIRVHKGITYIFGVRVIIVTWVKMRLPWKESV